MPWTWGTLGPPILSDHKSEAKYTECLLNALAAYSNQDEVGEAFSNIFGEGVVKREDVFVTSKLWNSEHAADKVRPACEKTLKELGLKQLDLYLVHWPVTGNQGPTLQPPYQVLPCPESLAASYCSCSSKQTGHLCRKLGRLWRSW